MKSYKSYVFEELIKVSKCLLSSCNACKQFRAGEVLAHVACKCPGIRPTSSTDVASFAIVSGLVDLAIRQRMANTSGFSSSA